MSIKQPNPVDVTVGMRIKLARRLSGLSQTAIAEKIGVTFQQLQKYENGTNRCGPSRLAPIAAATGKPIAWFFDVQDAAPAGADLVTEMLATPHGVDIARAFIAIKNNDHRITVARLVAALAGVAPADGTASVETIARKEAARAVEQYDSGLSARLRSLERRGEIRASRA